MVRCKRVLLRVVVPPLTTPQPTHNCTSFVRVYPCYCCATFGLQPSVTPHLTDLQLDDFLEKVLGSSKVRNELVNLVVDLYVGR